MKKKLTTLLIGGIVAAGLIATLGLAGCGSSSSSSSTASTDSTEGLQIFAANSLEKALPEVQALYTESHPDVTFADTQFKASGDLVSQIEAGATPDLLITASAGTMDDAESKSMVDSSTRTTMFTNDLVIVKAEGSDVEIDSLEDVVDIAEDGGKIAIGDAATVPAGKYANQALASVDLYTNAEGADGEYADSIADAINLADKVGTAASYVSTGDCAIGFVYTSDLYRYDGIEVAYTCPADSHKTISYPGAVCANAAQADVAADFLEFCLTDADAQKIWADYGFELAAE